MPEMDGWSVLRTLKADPEVSNIPVIMASILMKTKVFPRKQIFYQSQSKYL